MTLLAAEHGAEVHLCRWQDLPVASCDAVIVDAPYSEKTHAGHNQGAEDANKIAIARPDVLNNRTRYRMGLHQPVRGSIGYAAWGAVDVATFVEAWSPRTRGWIVTITDDQLAPIWSAALESAGRYVFAPLPYVAPGSRVRLTGDGPSGWTCWIVVARPRGKPYSAWGTLPGAYVVPSGLGDGKRLPVVGGKPAWLMQALVRDYTRPGDLVVDPCCGAGTTAVAAIREGRRAVVGDMDPKHAALAAQWVKNTGRPAPAARERLVEGQLSLVRTA